VQLVNWGGDPNRWNPDVQIEQLEEEPVAVAAVDTTFGHVPPLIVELAVSHYVASADEPTGGPWSFWVYQDVAWSQVRPSAWPNLSQAPPWSEVAERAVEAVGDRLLVMHNRAEYEVLHAHLPDWQPRGLVLTREVARHVWPGLDSYDLPYRRHAAAEVPAVALLLRELMRDAALPAGLRRGMPSMN
jgi:hypothetical protein